MFSLNSPVGRASLIGTLTAAITLIVVSMVSQMQRADAAPANVDADFRAELTVLYGQMYADLQTGDIIEFSDQAGSYKNVVCRFVRWDYDRNMQVEIAGDVDPNQRIPKESLRLIASYAKVYDRGTPEHERALEKFKAKQSSMYSPYADPLAVCASNRK